MELQNKNRNVWHDYKDKWKTNSLSKRTAKGFFVKLCVTLHVLYRFTFEYNVLV